MRGSLVAGAAAGALIQAGPALAAIAPGVGEALGIVHRLPASGGVALTFDDGPHPQGTPRVLEILREGGAPATFFLVGEQVARRPALVADIVAAGHRVELHCHRHRNLLRLTPRQFLDDAERAQAAIEEASGRAIVDHRPPYGCFSGATLLASSHRGWRPVLWSKWGRDWGRRATARSIVARSTAGLRDGDILLLHDADFYSASGSWERTAAALPFILKRIGEMGLKPVSL
jgi:peptidoglycan-N-acetylglucosamine deacetylase